MVMLSPMLVQLLLMLFNFLMLHPISSTPEGFRLELTHVDAAGNFTKLQLLQRAALRSKIRIDHLLLARYRYRYRSRSRSTHGATIDRARVPVRPSEGEYILDLAIGNPAMSFSAILDTGSDLIWTQCKPCSLCQPQPTPFYDPNRSSTYSSIPCSSRFCKALPRSKCTPECHFVYGYADNSSNKGVLGTETFTFGSRERVTISNLAFGCSRYTFGSTFNSSGLVGFGRSPLSLNSQLNIRKFSYCFTTFNQSKKSPLFFGSRAQLNRGGTIGRIGSTKIIREPTDPSFYYISLEGITVGKTRLPIPKSLFALKKDGSGGMIIDSGTAFTHLEEKGFKIVMEAFISQVKLHVANSPKNFDLICFKVPPGSSSAARVKVPKLIFHFEGADMDLQRENYVVEDEGLLCLTIRPSTDGLSIWGNLQQQNIHILYDLENDKLSFVAAQCERL